MLRAPGDDPGRRTQRADRMSSFVEDSHLDLSNLSPGLPRAQRTTPPGITCSVRRTVCQTGRECNGFKPLLSSPLVRMAHRTLPLNPGPSGCAVIAALRRSPSACRAPGTATGRVILSANGSPSSARGPIPGNRAQDVVVPPFCVPRRAPACRMRVARSPRAAPPCAPGGPARSQSWPGPPSGRPSAAVLPPAGTPGAPPGRRQELLRDGSRPGLRRPPLPMWPPFQRRLSEGVGDVLPGEEPGHDMPVLACVRGRPSSREVDQPSPTTRPHGRSWHRCRSVCRTSPRPDSVSEPFGLRRSASRAFGMGRGSTDLAGWVRRKQVAGRHRGQATDRAGLTVGCHRGIERFRWRQSGAWPQPTQGSAGSFRSIPM